MLKEYTLKVTVRVGGDDDAMCDDKLNEAMKAWSMSLFSDYEITHEQVVEPEVERE